MTRPKQTQTCHFGINRSKAAAILTMAFALAVAMASPAQAQTFKVLYNFAGAQDGEYPWAGLTMDGAGNLYGTAVAGGNLGSNCPYNGCGTVFKLSHKGSGWVFAPLYLFQGGYDGLGPGARVIFGNDGALYGTTTEGGNTCYNDTTCGTVFRLAPSATACKTVLCPWNETVIYRFNGGSDGYQPQGDLTLDQAGNLYGTTQIGGIPGCSGYSCGTVFELTPSGGGWTESVLYRFKDYDDGYFPYSGVIPDREGNLYGTTQGSNGTAFQLAPSGSSWTKTILHNFSYSDGVIPNGLLFDSAGNLYGTTTAYGVGDAGTAYELTPSGGSWNFDVLYAFAGTGGADGPYAAVIMDPAGNLYGTTAGAGAYGYGSVFKLTPGDGGWTYTSLHDFTGGTDGRSPRSSLVLDASGNLYGTALEGGTGKCDIWGCGVIFEITP
jgi:uncharacterized repeat protein (TIGR03803 family)